MKLKEITIKMNDECGMVETSEELKPIDYLTAISMLCNFARGEYQGDGEKLDKKIRLVTSRKFASMYCEEKMKGDR